jgi:hypothetical protein
MSGLALLPAFQALETPRVRDIERRFLERAGWEPFFTKRGSGKCRWIWRSPEGIEFTRGEAFVIELLKQSSPLGQ